ncbi:MULTISPECIES: hypothetical protein [unclassified Sphingobium]|uniref:hypothetical protein n=1 Tax=unclassified Sphingobium TaxID=2611147 RepID=UPI0010FA1097|nr:MULTISPECIES: hypothetical protein [unclassified Sphingobium]UXC89511.1 hypothetical protein EGM87_10515 [Sphingobium sp. RSMS]
MSNIKSRLAALEKASPIGPAIWRRIIQQPDQTEDEALDAYGHDRIAPTDRLIIRKIVDYAVQIGG